MVNKTFVLNSGLRKFCSLLLVLALGLPALEAPKLARAADGVSYKFSFSAYITNSGTPVTGTHNVTYAIYDSLTGGTLKYSQATTGVVFNAGFLTAIIGPVPPDLFNDNSRYLELTIDTVTLSPRLEIAASPYALNVDNLVGSSTTGISAKSSAGFNIKPYGAGAGQTTSLRYYDLGGTNYAGLQAPDAVTSSYTLKLPSSAPTASGQALIFTGSGQTSWGTATAVAGFSDLQDATAARTLFNSAFAQTWNWNGLTSGSGLTLTGTGLTSGKVLDVSTNSAGFTGNLINFAATAGAGTVLNVLQSGNGTATEITNTGTGYSFVVNDQAGDATPFVIDANGNVGVGTIAGLSSAKLSVAGTLTASKYLNSDNSNINTVAGEYDKILYDFGEYRGWGYNALDNSTFYYDSSRPTFTLGFGGNIGVGTTTLTSAIFDIQPSSGTGTIFRVGSATSQPNALVVDSDGDVGIGVANPTLGKLQIATTNATQGLYVAPTITSGSGPGNGGLFNAIINSAGVSDFTGVSSGFQVQNSAAGAHVQSFAARSPAYNGIINSTANFARYSGYSMTTGNQNNAMAACTDIAATSITCSATLVSGVNVQPSIVSGTGDTFNATTVAGIDIYPEGNASVGAPLDGTNNITNWYGVRVNDDATNAKMVVTNQYGVYVGQQNLNATNAWAFYQANATDKNYFAGNLGVGTTVPVSKFAVTGSTTFTNVSDWYGLSSTPAVGSANIGRIYYDTTLGKFRVSQAGAAYADLVSSGGSSGGSANLSSIASATANNTIFNNNFIQTWNWEGLTTGTGLALTGTALTSGQLFSLIANGGTALNIIQNSSGTGTQITNTGTGNSFAVYDQALDATPFLVDAVGNVGVGVNTPAFKLQVAGTIAPDVDSVYDLGSSALRWRDLYLSGSSIDLGGQKITNASGILTWAGSGLSTTGLLSVGSITSSGTATFATGGGNIGVGTSAPAQKLDVNGSIQIVATDASNNGMLFQNGTRTFHTYGTDNLFLGKNSGNVTLTNSQNTALGIDALSNLTSGRRNTALGYQAMWLNTTGQENVALGRIALQSNTTGSNNVALGVRALVFATTGSNNTAIGDTAMGGVAVTGTHNTAVGVQALQNVTGGSRNVAMGTGALLSAGNGVDNVAIGGTQAGYYNQDGTDNIFIGSYAGVGNGVTYTGASANIFIGRATGQFISNNVGSNTVIGYMAGNQLSTGNNNILLGFKAGEAITTGSNNIVMGYDIDAPSATGSNQLTIGNLLFGTGIDGSGTTLSTGNIGVGTTAPMSKFAVTGTTTFTNVSDWYGLSSTPGVSPSSAGRIYYDTALNKFRVSQNGAAYADLVGGGSSLTGSTGQVAYFSGANTAVGTSALFIATSGNLGIGTASPLASLTLQGTSTYDVLQVATAGGVPKLVMNSNGNIGIGTSTADSGPLVVQVTNATGVIVQRAGGSAGITFKTTGGSFDAPSAVTSGFQLGQLRVSPYDGSTFATGIAPFAYVADENWSSTAHGSRIDFATISNGSTAALTRMQIASSGNVGIGLTSGISALLSVASATPGSNMLFGVGAATQGNLFSVLGGGNIGIGTTTPGMPLEVWTGTNKFLHSGNDPITSIFLGYQAGNSANLISNTVAIGAEALKSIVSGNGDNTVVGWEAAMNLTTGIQNSFIGRAAYRAATWGNHNVYLGAQAGITTGGGDRNVVIGFGNSPGASFVGTSNIMLGDNSGAYNITSGSYNVMLGNFALTGLTTGTANIAIGRYAGGSTSENTSLVNLSTGNYTTALGHASGFASAALTNATAIGAFSLVGASNTIALGGSGRWAVNVGIGTSSPMAKFAVHPVAGDVYSMYVGSSTPQLVVKDLFGNASVGVGETNPNGNFHVNMTNGSIGDVRFQRAGGPSGFEGRYSNGSIASPTAVAQNNQMLIVRSSGYNGSAYSTGAQFGVVASQAWTATAKGSQFEVGVIADNSTTVNTNLIVHGTGTCIGYQGSCGGSYNKNLSATLDVPRSTSTSDLDIFRVLTDVGGAQNTKFRIDSDGDVFSDGVDNLGGGADYAENYFSDTELTPGSVVVKKLTGGLKDVTESNYGYQKNVMGVISTKPGSILDSGEANQPGPGQYIATVALSGRAPVKVTNENGNIQVGDYITSSAKFPGYGMKATRSGVVIGQAIEVFEANGESSGKVEVFMGVGYHNVNNIFELEPQDAVLTGMQNADPLLQSGSSTSFIINQKGTSDILKLQKDGVDKFVVKNDGTLAILTELADQQVEVLALSNNGQKILTVNAAGHIYAQKDTVGSVSIGVGQNKVTVTFTTPYKVAPKVMVTSNTFARYRVISKSTTGFTVELEETATEPVSFDWIAIAPLDTSATTIENGNLPSSGYQVGPPPGASAPSQPTSESEPAQGDIQSTEQTASEVVEEPTAPVAESEPVPDQTTGTQNDTIIE
ncbi:MAG TPA: hypothetical protein VEA59_04475 [Patescibacteria group bacterium]|nr:hypothetical protein [Patescibacteria group bacterium]